MLHMADISNHPGGALHHASRPDSACTPAVQALPCAHADRSALNPSHDPSPSKPRLSFLCSHVRCPPLWGRSPHRTSESLSPVSNSALPGSQHLPVCKDTFYPACDPLALWKCLGTETSELCTEIDPLMMSSFSRTDCFVCWPARCWVLTRSSDTSHGREAGTRPCGGGRLCALRQVASPLWAQFLYLCNGDTNRSAHLLGLM